MPERPTYNDNVIDVHRFRFCPKCATELIQKVLFDDNIPRATCPECGWIQLMLNAAGVATVAHNGSQVAVIQPPGADGISLPAGLIEYGESPEESAVREVAEETGLEAKLVDELGWCYIEQTQWPGPLFYFMYEAEIIGGSLRGSEEGEAMLVDMQKMPPVATGRHGSRRTLDLFFAKRG